MKEQPAAATSQREDILRRLLHDLSGSLFAVSLQLESASRSVSRGNDPSEALATARRELDRTFDLFERGRSALLSEPAPPKEEPRT